jgi:putative aldouronate transport system permease protein
MKRSIGEKTFDVLIYGLLSALVIVTAYPMIHVVFASVSEPSQLAESSGLILYPRGFSLEPYELLFKNPLILSGFANTVFMLFFGIIVNIVMTAIAAYILSRKGVKLVKPMTVFIVFTMLFSGGLVPFFLTIKSVGLYNSLWGLIIPFAVNTIYLIVLRTAFEGVPASIEESARMDGAGHITILFRILLPLVMPAVAVLILYYSVDRWNGWFYASVFLRDRELYPLQLVLREILLINDQTGMTAGGDTARAQQLGESIKYSAIIVGTLPVMLLYPFLQRYFIKGATIGAVKG